MLEVSMMLHDPAELAMFAHFANKIEARRKMWAAHHRDPTAEVPKDETLDEAPVTPERCGGLDLAPSVSGSAFDNGGGGAGDPVGSAPLLLDTLPTPAEPAAEDPETRVPGLTAAVMENALRGFLGRHGMPATLGVFNVFGITRIGEIDEKRKAALFARLQA